MFYRDHSVTREKGLRAESSVSPLFCWRPRRDLNPRYRRERELSAGNLQKPQARIALQRALKHPQERLLNPYRTLAGYRRYAAVTSTSRTQADRTSVDAQRKTGHCVKAATDRNRLKPDGTDSQPWCPKELSGSLIGPRSDPDLPSAFDADDPVLHQRGAVIFEVVSMGERLPKV